MGLPSPSFGQTCNDSLEDERINLALRVLLAHFLPNVLTPRVRRKSFCFRRDPTRPPSPDKPVLSGKIDSYSRRVSTTSARACAGRAALVHHGAAWCADGGVPQPHLQHPSVSYVRARCRYPSRCPLYHVGVCPGRRLFRQASA